MLPTGRARQARPAPADGPLPRGYIDTGDLMPVHEPTRVDVATRGYLERLRAAARPSPAAQQINRAGVAAIPPPAMAAPPPPPVPVGGFAVGRPPALPSPDKTVYVSLNRPDGWLNDDWRGLVRAVGRQLHADWIVQRSETQVDAETPMVLWVLIIPADRVVDAQEAIMRVLVAQKHPARVIWAEATPRTIGRHG